ncbi:MAG: glutathione S-transferase family protein [Verrucomicrobiota bacterium]
MIELVQLPWSPFCIVQRRILEFSGVQFKITNLPRAYGDRSLVWKLTKKKYYAVPVIRDGAKVIYESGDDTQDIARHLDAKLKLGLFPVAREGEQSVLWRYFEHEIEAVGFRLNDIYWREFVTKGDELPFLRHKERKFGRGCVDQWRAQQKDLLRQLEQLLRPCEQMLAHSEFLLGDRPLFVDFELFGMIGNFLYTGRYALPKSLPNLREWYRCLTTIRLAK